MKTAIISSSDQNYYPLLREWLHSIRRFEESADIDICIIDSGMTAQQRAELEPLVTKIVTPDWPDPKIKKKAKGLDHLKACVCRPFIPVMFPGYKTYLWMDSDTWVQDWAGVAMFINAARNHPDALVITSDADRAYGAGFRIRWFWRLPIRVRNFYYANGRRAFGFAAAKKLLSKAVLSAACFALDGDAPHWKRWQELVVPTAVKGKVFTAEQTALGYLVHIEGYGVELLPSYALWQCHATPVWDNVQQAFVESCIPHVKAGILHLSCVDAMRKDRNVTIPVRVLQGGTTTMNLRYPHYDGGMVQTGAPKRR